MTDERIHEQSQNKPWAKNHQLSHSALTKITATAPWRPIHRVSSHVDLEEKSKTSQIKHTSVVGRYTIPHKRITQASEEREPESKESISQASTNKTNQDLLSTLEKIAAEASKKSWRWLLLGKCFILRMIREKFAWQLNRCCRWEYIEYEISGRCQRGVSIGTNGANDCCSFCEVHGRCCGELNYFITTSRIQEIERKVLSIAATQISDLNTTYATSPQPKLQSLLSCLDMFYHSP